MTVSEYSSVRQQLIISFGSYDRHLNLLNTLKSFYKDVINSPRRFEKISSLGELLYVLETRDVLSEDNVEPFKRIAQYLPNRHELEKRIAQYEANHVPREIGNHYAAENVPSKRNTPPAQNIISNNPYGQMSPEKRKRILTAVKEEIGNSWRDLARNLKVREHQINAIDVSNKSLEMKAAKVLEIFLLEKAQPDQWFFELCNALDKTRRKDLTKSLRKIMEDAKRKDDLMRLIKSSH